jgi:hypothetical protein
MDPIAAGARLHPVWFRHACTSSLRRVDVPEDMRQRDVRVAVSDNVMFFDAT